MERWRTLIHKMITKQKLSRLKEQIKNEQIKRKQTCSVRFLKCFNSKKASSKDHSKEFLENNNNDDDDNNNSNNNNNNNNSNNNNNNNNNDNKDFLEKPPVTMIMHDMINKDGQGRKIGSH